MTPPTSDPRPSVPLPRSERAEKAEAERDAALRTVGEVRQALEVWPWNVYIDQLRLMERNLGLNDVQSAVLGTIANALEEFLSTVASPPPTVEGER